MFLKSIENKAHKIPDHMMYTKFCHVPTRVQVSKQVLFECISQQAGMNLDYNDNVLNG